MEEIRKDIEGYEGMYQVSNLGRFKSLSRITMNGGKYPVMTKERILRTTVSDKYLFVSLSKDGKNRKIKTHRLVAKAFITNPENKRTVNHKDGNPLNNHVDNLEWMTHSENHKHSYANLGRVSALKGVRKYGSSNPSARAIGQYNDKGELLNIFGSIVEMEYKLGLHKQQINKYLKGKTDYGYGYVWKYIDNR